jgi:hypothetical protein
LGSLQAIDPLNPYERGDIFSGSLRKLPEATLTMSSRFTASILHNFSCGGTTILVAMIPIATLSLILLSAVGIFPARSRCKTGRVIHVSTSMGVLQGTPRCSKNVEQITMLAQGIGLALPQKTGS